MRLIIIKVTAVAVAAVSAIAIFALLDSPEEVAHQSSGDDLAVVSFLDGNDTLLEVKCEVAETYEERVRGLMNRSELEVGRGMLFVFESNSHSPFWMKNTLIPLDIIFISENGTVINVEEALVEDPETPDAALALYRSDAPYKWVVEINMGLCRQHGIGPGTEVDIEMPD